MQALCNLLQSIKQGDLRDAFHLANNQKRADHGHHIFEQSRRRIFASMLLPAQTARLLPPSVPATAPSAPPSKPIHKRPLDAPMAAPEREPVTTRKMNAGGILRLGVFGSLSLTISPSAATVKIHGVHE